LGVPLRRVILDVDTGVDDALAILLALASPELGVEAITTVDGNIDVGRTTLNTLKVLEMAGVRDIPVAMGTSRPLSPRGSERMLVEGEVIEGGKYFHGRDGLADLGLPPPRLEASREHAVDLMIRLLEEAVGEITIITLGPLTNLAVALLREPEMTEMIEEHIMMGGWFALTPYSHGNVTPVSEFNIWHDPWAAWIVFHSGMKTTAVGLDVGRRRLWAWM